MFDVEPVISALILLLITGVALYVHPSRRYVLVALFLVLFALDYIFTRSFVTFTKLFGIYDILAIPGTNLSWTGSLVSFSWAFVFVHFSFLSFREVGFTFKQRPETVSSALVITTVVLVFSLAVGFTLTDEMPFSSETLLFYATMPGLAEEMVYRGVFLALLHRAFTAGADGTYNWWPAILSTLAFTLMHPFFEMDGWSVTFNFANLWLPLIGGAVFVWLREQTGSLVFPIIAHNLSNTSFYLMGVL